MADVPAQGQHFQLSIADHTVTFERGSLFLLLRVPDSGLNESTINMFPILNNTVTSLKRPESQQKQLSSMNATSSRILTSIEP